MTVAKATGKAGKIKVWIGSRSSKKQDVIIPPRVGAELQVVKNREDAQWVALTPWQYEELLERAEDAAAVAAYRKTRGEEAFPAEILDQMLAGETPLRVWRRHRGMTQQELASKIGISKSHLSEVESGKGEFSLATLRKAAEAMGIDPASLFVLDGKD
jgi:DNA-binding XRE family transcriptional regulator